MTQPTAVQLRELVKKWREEAADHDRHKDPLPASILRDCAIELESTLSALTAEAGKGELPELPELPTPFGPWHSTSDGAGYYTYTADQRLDYARLAFSGGAAKAAVTDAMVKAAAISLANHERRHPNPAAYWEWLHETERAKLTSRARAALESALALSTATPAGEWVLVPREPTPEMVLAYNIANALPPNHRNLSVAGYTAMLAASPRGASESK